MKPAINIWSFHGESTFEEKLRLASEAGFEGFEIDLTEDGPVSLSGTTEASAKVVQQVQAAGLTLSGLATGLYWGANPASAESATREKAASILRRQIAAARELGTDAILVVPGTVGADFIPDCEQVPYDQAWKRARAFVEAALPEAEAAGVFLCIENVWNKFLVSPLELRDFIDSFESPWVRSYLDVGNVLALGYPEDWIRILGKRIHRVHFKDYRRNVGSVDGFCDLLSGDVNWPAVVTALREVGYDGWVAAEMIPPVPFYKHCPDVLIESTARALQRILAL